LEQKTEKMENYIFRTVDGQAQSIRRHTGEGLKRNTLPRLLDKCIAQLSDWGELQIRGISQQAGRQIRVAGRISTVPVDAASIENLPIDRDKILRRLGRAECDRRYRAERGGRDRTGRRRCGDDQPSGVLGLVRQCEADCANDCRRPAHDRSRLSRRPYGRRVLGLGEGVRGRVL
jgi:hypothetical protein